MIKEIDELWYWKHKYRTLQEEFTLYKKKQAGASSSKRQEIRKLQNHKCVCGAELAKGQGAIHHEDKNRLNNKNSNLQLLCEECHFQKHQ